ncbi:hypothetical protein DZC41_01940 [Acinetobacter haemolyticus]|uniref:hypothetical protein n=1 Tax=Acinetobacter haemolyticus TaxID=29430 RepID=UPI0009492D04|nr:hypothetical protein [Acinetobacter haemolyticus]APR69972.1 hypothetical protein AHTJS_06010 [Acinetobacter haemolyticus]NAR36426.1 hypothetical protein [Acinetobacter haemolyticus]NCU22266.1 hypothetical protein [Acinetobacter haemolyticus]
MLRATIIILAGLCSIVTLLWAILKPGFDSWGAFLAAFIVFLSSFKIPKKLGNTSTPISIKNEQEVSDDSIGLQANVIQGVVINKGNGNVEQNNAK